MAGVINAIVVKYGLEDKLGKGTEGAPGASETPEALEAEGHKLIANPAYRDFQHPDHKTVRAKAEEIFAKMAKLKK
jgi:hypothetical protein